MSNLFYIYLASGVFFLLIEMLTATFYGLSVSVACFVLAMYVYMTGDASMTVTQGILLAVISALFAYFLPKWLRPNTPNLKSGLDAHIGQSFRLERVGTDWKVKIDGVDYLIDDDSETPDFEVGKKVRLESHDSGILKVSVVK
ncbi:MAG: NfeD family protein [Candidatus Gracilibacteria bacterium]|nr:NfeD family protein [Candidatus Gracilibacteria bacterium]